MATMTITVTVTGRQGGNTITWSRTATVSDITGAVHRTTVASNQTELEVAVGSETTKGGAIYSTGLSTIAVINNGANGILSVQPQDSSGTTIRCGVLGQGVPFFLYNNSGAGGFSGGFSYDSSNGLTPTSDIDKIAFVQVVGNCPYSLLIGTKLIS